MQALRFAVGIEYDGSAFFGWQTQRQTPTVQATVEQALAKVANQPVSLVCAGRTDTGVHARCQVAHFDTRSRRSERSWVLGANSNLPATVSLLWAQRVDTEFHARFSALARRYRYRILNRWVRPAIDSGRIAWCRKPLDAGAMHRAAQVLLGEHDFTSFRSAGCTANHAVRKVHEVAVRRDGEIVLLDISANAFLYHMVRNIAGALLEVGSGDKPESWLGEVLDQRDRRVAGVTAGAEGLYFMSVRYPAHFGLPARVEPFPPASGLA